MERACISHAQPSWKGSNQQIQVIHLCIGPKGQLPSAMGNLGHATLSDDEMVVSKRTVPLRVQAEYRCLTEDSRPSRSPSLKWSK